MEGGNIQYYIELMKTDPRKTRKQREFPTTAIHIQILEEWCTGHNGATWLARHELAQALRRHLAYQKSIAPPDISAQVDNIFVATPRATTSPTTPSPSTTTSTAASPSPATSTRT